MRFRNGSYVNTHCKKNKLKHIRITAGPQRDRYVHELVCMAKIVGRREAFEALNPGVPIPENDFYSLEFETVDHEDGDSLNNWPTNLTPCTIAENVRRENSRRKARNDDKKRRKQQKKQEKASASAIPNPPAEPARQTEPECPF